MTTHLLVHYQTQAYQVSLPDDVPLHALIPAIAHKLNLPTQQEAGAFVLFYLVHQEQILPFEQTLAQLQLPDKAEVLLEQTAVDPLLHTHQTDFSELDAHLHRPRRRARSRRYPEPPRRTPVDSSPHTHQTNFSELDAHLHRPRRRTTSRSHEEPPPWLMNLIFAIVFTLLLLFFIFVVQ